MKGKERKIQVGAHQAHLIEIGSGPPVVLLSAMLIWAPTYAPLIERLGQRFQVIAVEMPGSGRASRLPVPWSFERYAAFGAGLLEALDLDRTALIGHSNSGAVAMIMGALYPERIAKLALLDPVGVNPPGSAWRLALTHARDIPFEPRFSLHAAPGLLYNLFRHPRDVFSQVRLAARENLTGYATRVAVPTLLGWGARDRTVPLRDGYLLHRLIPGSTLYVSPTGLHDWLIEEAEELVEVFTAFVEQGGS